MSPMYLHFTSPLLKSLAAKARIPAPRRSLGTLCRCQNRVNLLLSTKLGIHLLFIISSIGGAGFGLRNIYLIFSIKRRPRINAG